jgi:hypothetical protein
VSFRRRVHDERAVEMMFHRSEKKFRGTASGIAVEAQATIGRSAAVGLQGE